MVDLVKIRKKARDQKESGNVPSGNQTPESKEESREGTGPDAKPSVEAAAAAASKRSEPRKKSKKQSEKQKSSKSRVTGSSGHNEPEPVAADQPPEDASSHEPPDSISIDESPAVTVDEGESGESRLSRFKRTAGVLAEGNVREQKDEQEKPSEDLLEVITFNLAGEQYAMDVDHLVEIIVPRASTRVPNASEEVIGIISLRGSIVTILDLRKMLKHAGRGEETEDTRIVVVQHESERIGFIVDKVLRVVKVEKNSIEPQPIVSAAEHDDVVRGVFVSGESITIYLDLPRIAGDRGVS